MALGQALGRLCLPGDATEVLGDLFVPRAGRTLDLIFDSADNELLSLPFESIRLDDGTLGGLLVATRPNVQMLRRPTTLMALDAAVLAGPIKVLIAVGAPDELESGSPVLDHEHEVAGILDAVEEARRFENVEVRILEVGSPEAIGEAFARDQYHVLYLTCHRAGANRRPRTGFSFSRMSSEVNCRPSPTTS